MTNLLALNAHSRTRRMQSQPQPEQKPEMAWVVDSATGRPVMMWSFPQPAKQSEAA